MPQASLLKRYHEAAIFLGVQVRYLPATMIAPDSGQLEAPGPRSEHLSPFEILCYDVQCETMFYGQAERTTEGRAVRSGGPKVLALA